MTTDKTMKPKSSGKGWLKYGNPPGDLSTAPRCGARTRTGKPCMAPAVRGKRRCRMHGGTNPGRPRDPKVQMIKHARMVRRYIKKMCQDCDFNDADCVKVFGGKNTPEEFERRKRKYCRLI